MSARYYSICHLSYLYLSLTGAGRLGVAAWRVSSPDACAEGHTRRPCQPCHRTTCLLSSPHIHRNPAPVRYVYFADSGRAACTPEDRSSLTRCIHQHGAENVHFSWTTERSPSVLIQAAAVRSGGSATNSHHANRRGLVSPTYRVNGCREHM